MCSSTRLLLSVLSSVLQVGWLFLFSSSSPLQQNDAQNRIPLERDPKHLLQRQEVCHQAHRQESPRTLMTSLPPHTESILMCSLTQSELGGRQFLSSFTFIFRAFSKTLSSKATYNRYIRQKKRETTVYLCRYRKDAHRTKCQALTIARLTHSPNTYNIQYVCTLSARMYNTQ